MSRRPVIYLQSGVSLNIVDFCSEHVRLQDIIESLSKQCRYMGHCSRFYSVAEHSVTCMRMAEQVYGEGSLEACCALLHDAHEAYIMDFPTPHKEAIPGYREVEGAVEKIVRQHLHLPRPLHPVWDAVKELDTELLHMEASVLFDPPPPWAREPSGVFPLDWIDGDDWEMARDEFKRALYRQGFDV